MPKRIATYTFAGETDAERYQTDFGRFVDGLNFLVQYNDNITVERAQQFGEALNAQLVRYRDFTDPALQNPCPVGDIITPRRLTFTLAGNDQRRRNITFAARDNATLLTRRDALSELLEADYAAVQCVELEGESVPNMGDFFGSYNVNGVVQSGASSIYYTGQIDYELDAGGRVLLPFKILSPSATAPPAIFSSQQAQQCLGDVINTDFSCGSSSGAIDHRRLTVSYLVQGNEVENRELPVIEASLIEGCADNLVGLLGVGCVAYTGTRDRRFHLRQAQTQA